MFLSLLHVNVGDDPDQPQPGQLWLRDVYSVHQRLWMAFPDSQRRIDDPFFLGAWDGPNVPDPKPQRREAGFLFRIEHDGSPRILVQSVQEPDWEYAFQNAPYLLTKPPTEVPVRSFDPAPHPDQVYRFRLLANVVKRKSFPHPKGETRATRAGWTIPLRRRAEILVRPNPIPEVLPGDPIEQKQLLFARWDPWRKWLKEMGAAQGFRIIDEQTSPLFMEPLYISVRNPDKERQVPNRQRLSIKRYNAGLFNGMLVCTDPERLRNAIINGIGSGKAFGFGLLSLAPVER